MTIRIRYTNGPAQLALGSLALTRGVWADADAALARQALLRSRVEEFGFEVEGLPGSVPAPIAAEAADQPAAKPRGQRKTEE